MITTITLNPAIDKFIILPALTPGAVNRAHTARSDIGGKGINASKTIKALNGKTTATGFLGGSTGALIRQYLAHENIQNDFIPILGENRTNLKIQDDTSNQITEINEEGPQVTAEELSALKKKIKQMAQAQGVFVFSGSIPPNVNADIYRELIKIAKTNTQNYTILDADGDALLEGIKAKPFALKPNLSELERLFHMDIHSLKDISLACKTLLNKGIQLIIVSMGAGGVFIAARDKMLRASAVKVRVKSTVGAGDAVCGAWAYALDHSMEFSEATRLSVAAGTAKVLQEGNQMPRIEAIRWIQKSVKLVEVY